MSLNYSSLLSISLYYLFYIIYFIILYFLGIWVFQDANRRGLNGYFWCVLCVFFPAGSVPFYLLLRPKKIINNWPYNEFDKKERPHFRVYFVSLASGLLNSIFMTLRYFFFMSFNNFYESIYILKNKELKKMDKMLKKEYFFKSPVHMARRVEEDTGMPHFSLTYGESPYSTVVSVFKYLNLKEDDVFFDLGSGVGQVVFFVNLYFNIPCTGIEIVPFFVEKSNFIKKRLSLEKVEFICGDFLEENIEKGTIFYINGKAFNLEIIEKLTEKLKNVKNGTKIISIGYPFSGSFFRLMGKSMEFFSWGWEVVYVQQKYSD